MLCRPSDLEDDHDLPVRRESKQLLIQRGTGPGGDVVDRYVFYILSLWYAN